MGEDVVEDAAKDRNIEIEEQKLALERERLSVERGKAKWSAVSSVVPIVVALGTIVYGVWSLRQTAQVQFDTKVVEIALQAQTTHKAVNRASTAARVLSNLSDFNPPKDFEQRLQLYDQAIKEIRSQESDSDDPSIESKMQLIKLIAEHPDHKQEIVKTWRTLFPRDEWVSSLANEDTTPNSKRGRR